MIVSKKHQKPPISPLKYAIQSLLSTKTHYTAQTIKTALGGKLSPSRGIYWLKTNIYYFINLALCANRFFRRLNMKFFKVFAPFYSVQKLPNTDKGQHKTPIIKTPLTLDKVWQYLCHHCTA